MPDNLTTEKLLLVGAGRMAIEYAKILKELNTSFTVIGRGTASAKKFHEQTGIAPSVGGITALFNSTDMHLQAPEQAIIAVNVEGLASTVKLLLEKGVKKILVEKPGGLNLQEISALAKKAEEVKAEVYIAYNRRFYASTKRARELIDLAGGVTSFSFDFTEWSSAVASNDKISDVVKANWFLANSTHVVDLAFFLGGKPSSIQCYKTGEVAWHPTAAVFAGAGRTEAGALFSYHANWAAPGRWKVELLTRENKLILCPLEELSIQRLDSISVEKVILDDALDKQFKPGLYLQTKAFLTDNQDERLLSVKEFVQLTRGTYRKIAY